MIKSETASCVPVNYFYKVTTLKVTLNEITISKCKSGFSTTSVEPAVTFKLCEALLGFIQLICLVQIDFGTLPFAFTFTATNFDVSV